MEQERTEKQLQELLGKYLDGTSSELESKQVEEWYQSFKGNDGTASVFSSPEEEEDEYSFILGNIHSQIQPASQSRKTFSQFILNARLKIASIAALLLIAAGSSYYYIHNINVAPQVNHIYTAVAGAGKMKLIELVDGTKIWLNSTSKLSYPERFSPTLREVTLLEGEAFFEIAHESKRPFIVHSKGLNTQVLGTSFNINAYKYSEKIEVTVSTGKVAVSVGADLIDYLTPNEQIKYHLLTGRILKQSVKGAASPWMNGDIVLDQVDFESLKAILFNNYNYELKGSGKKITKLHFSATLKKTDEINNVLKLISAINHTRYKLINNEITMY